MNLVETSLDGAFVIGLDKQVDERGFFARTFCRDEFAAHGLDLAIAQCNVSFTAQRGTLRGLHYQVEPHAEAKVVRCVAGAIFDVVVDLRPTSPTYLRWFGTTLDTSNRDALYIPVGCAHGFITLTSDAEVLYQMSAPYVPEAARGIRWDDPKIAIAWPMQPTLISARDAAYDLL